MELPVFEDTELFKRGVGESTDVVSKEMYTFEDRGGRSLTLRPEGTAGVMRSVIENNLDKLKSEPVWYAITPGSYENLAFNTQEMLRFIKQQKTIIQYYEGATAPK
jgi:hypothetical protein